MLYFTFGDEVFAQRLKDTHALLLQQNATVHAPLNPPPQQPSTPPSSHVSLLARWQVGDVYEAITEYAELMEDSQGNMDLFDFLAARFG
jgi:hypothetical protein